jgi:hypothetical protein
MIEERFVIELLLRNKTEEFTPTPGGEVYETPNGDVLEITPTADGETLTGEQGYLQDAPIEELVENEDTKQQYIEEYKERFLKSGNLDIFDNPDLPNTHGPKAVNIEVQTDFPEQKIIVQEQDFLANEGITIHPRKIITKNP